MHFGGADHGNPVSVTVSSSAFSSQFVELDAVTDDGYFYFFAIDLALDGVLMNGGLADVTVVVDFA